MDRGGHACTAFILAPVFITARETPKTKELRGWRRYRAAENTNNNNNNKSSGGEQQPNKLRGAPRGEEPPSLGLCAKTAPDARGFTANGTWMLPEPAGASNAHGDAKAGGRAEAHLQAGRSALESRSK